MNSPVFLFASWTAEAAIGASFVPPPTHWALPFGIPPIFRTLEKGVMMPRRGVRWRKIEGREHCHPDDAELPLDWILQQVTGRSGLVDFMMVETARCPNCKRGISEKTLVEW